MSTDTLTEAEVAAIRYCLVHRTNMVSMTWPDAAARLLAERDALREALKDVQNRLIPLMEAVQSLKPSQPSEKPPFKSVGDQIDELSRLMILHANAAKRFALIGKDVSDMARAALGEK